jgi:hypothetical protein
MRRRLALFAIAFVLGCSSPDEPCVVADGIAGTWTYQATRESPVPGTITGSLVIGSHGCVDFQGAMDVVETLATGETHRVTGPVSGNDRRRTRQVRGVARRGRARTLRAAGGRFALGQLDRAGRNDPGERRVWRSPPEAGLGCP